jgi:hypothetical protein
MDPIANIKEQRALSRDILRMLDKDDLQPSEVQTVMHYASELAELVQALDAWQTSGGFSPYAHKQGPVPF